MGGACRRNTTAHNQEVKREAMSNSYWIQYVVLLQIYGLSSLMGHNINLSGSERSNGRKKEEKNSILLLFI